MSTRRFSSALRALAAASVFVCAAAGAQQVTVSRDSTLHSEPKPDAAAVAQLKQGTTGEVLGRQGAWVNVKTSSGTGWMFAFNVTYPSTGGGAPGASASRKPSTTPTMGIRGLEKEDMKNATFDSKQLDALDSFADDSKGRKK